MDHCNANELGWDRDVLIRLREWAATHPDRCAVRCGARDLTYRQLAGRCSIVAHWLRSVAPARARVALLIARDVDIPTALLGTLEADMCLVPIDPTAPIARVRDLMRTARVSAIIHDVDLAPEHAALDLASLDLRTMACQGAASAAPVDPAPDQPAYVLFTSGSEGRPRGVVVGRGSLAVSVGARALFYPEPVQRVLHAFTYAFDSSLAPLFHSLVAGAELLIADEADRRDPEALLDLIERHAIDCVYLNPNLWSLVIDASTDRDLTALRVVAVAGEACAPQLVGKHHARLPHARLVNEYGPTEATVWSTAHSCRVEDGQGNRVPIGHAIRGYSTYVCDDNGARITEAGREGQLYIGGRGLALGYLDDPDTTAAKYIADPFAETAGARMYATGDRVALREDGTLDFLGRIDRQLKIRGYRIEPSEVESLLRADSRIADVAVVGSAETPPRLVAYYVPRAADSVGPDELAAAMRERAIDPMVPTVWRACAAIPRTARDKVDYAALPSLDAPVIDTEDGSADTDVRFEPIAAAFRAVLGLTQVGLDDDFFALGGDSIRAIQLRNKLAAAGIKLPLRALLAKPTVRAIAAAGATEAPASTPAAVLDPITPEQRAALPIDIEQAYPATPLQLAMLSAPRGADGRWPYLDTSYVQLSGAVSIPTLQAALDHLVARHSALRTSFDVEKGLARIHPTAKVEVQVHAARGEAARTYFQQWVHTQESTSFDVTKPGLCRVTVVESGPEEAWVMWAFHHAVADGWSSAVFARDLFATYVAVRDGTPVSSEPVSSSDPMVRHALAVNNAIETGSSRSYWTQTLQQTEALRTFPGTQSGMTQEVEATVDSPLVERLAAVARELRVPLKSVLLTAAMRTFATLTGQRNGRAGVITHARPDDGIESIGLFLTPLPIGLGLVEGSWAQSITRIYEQEKAWHGHHHLPASTIAAAVGGGPLFQTAFNYVDFHLLNEVADNESLRVLDSGTSGHHNLPLSIAASRTRSGGLTVTVFADDGLVSRGQRNAVSRWYLEVLRRIAADPSGSSASAIGEVVAPARPRPRHDLDLAIVDVVADVARRDADRPAVIDDRRSLSYGQLHDAVERVAAGLAEHLSPTSGAEPMVLVHGDGGPDQLVAMLAVWRAGAVYVPISPEWPAARVREIAERLQPMCSIALDPEACPLANTLVLGQLERRSTAPCRTEDPQGLAYVLHTSGSTGTPKAVAVSHHALRHHLDWRHREFPPTGATRMLAKAAPVFDIALWEVLSPLLAGQAVVFAPASERQDPAALIARLRAHAATDAHATPTLLHSLLDAGLHSVRTLTRVFVGGSELHPGLLARFMDTMPATVELVHQYGPTETTIDVCMHRCGIADGHKVPIGTSASDVVCIVVDEDGALAPDHAPGELWVGGPCVAREYLGQAEATAASFVPAPHDPALRMYRTGDRVRRRGDGALEYLGRIDRQVKVRGQRVELGEVEWHARAVPGVREAVVGIFDDGRALWLVVEGTADRSEIVAALSSAVAEVFVPRVVLVESELPRLPSGKPDHKELGHRVAASLLDSAEPSIETSATLQSVISLCAEVAGVQQDRIGDNTDLFALGATSIGLIQLASVVSARYGVELDLEEMFINPTAGAIAARIDAEQAPEDQAPIVAPQSGSAALVGVNGHLHVEPLGPKVFAGTAPADGRARFFGGQLCAQALGAAVAVAGELPARSVHARFLHAADANRPVHYEVEPLASTSVAETLEVRGRQNDRIVFTLSVALGRPLGGPSYQVPMPVVPAPEKIPSLDEHIQSALARGADPLTEALARSEQPFVVHPLDRVDPEHTTPRDGPLRMWFKARNPIGDDPRAHEAALLFASDILLSSAALGRHGMTPWTPGLAVASLDHAVWFHRPVRVDEWLLHVSDAESTGDGVGVSHGRIYSLHGELVATLVQQNLMTKDV